MLRTNSRQARENIRGYIVDNFTPDDYTDTPPKDWHGIAVYLLECFYSEKVHLDQRYKVGNLSRYDLFAEWAAGLPSILDTCYYYNRSAVDDLGALLEETEQQKNRFSEAQAADTLTRLIYRELVKEGQNAPLMERLSVYGYPAADMFHHCTDLYIYVTPDTTSVLDHWCEDNGYRRQHFCPVFTDQQTGRKMYDCAFQYLPEWDEHCKGV